MHPNQISVWKRRLLEQSSSLFERKNKKDEEYNQLKKEKEELFRQLGQMGVPEKVITLNQTMEYMV